MLHLSAIADLSIHLFSLVIIGQCDNKSPRAIIIFAFLIYLSFMFFIFFPDKVSTSNTTSLVKEVAKVVHLGPVKNPVSTETRSSSGEQGWPFRS